MTWWQYYRIFDITKQIIRFTIGSCVIKTMNRSEEVRVSLSQKRKMKKKRLSKNMILEICDLKNSSNNQE